MDVVLGDFMSSIGYRVKSLDNLFGDIKGKELCDLVIVAKCNSLPFFYQNVNLDILGCVNFLFLYLLSLKAHSRGKTRAEV